MRSYCFPGSCRKSAQPCIWSARPLWEQGTLKTYVDRSKTLENNHMKYVCLIGVLTGICISVLTVSISFFDGVNIGSVIFVLLSLSNLCGCYLGFRAVCENEWDRTSKHQDSMMKKVGQAKSRDELVEWFRQQTRHQLIDWFVEGHRPDRVQFPGLSVLLFAPHLWFANVFLNALRDEKGELPKSLE